MYIWYTLENLLFNIQPKDRKPYSPKKIGNLFLVYFDVYVRAVNEFTAQIRKSIPNLFLILLQLRRVLSCPNFQTIMSVSMNLHERYATHSPSLAARTAW